MCIDSLLNCRYLQVSGLVRVNRGVVGRLGLGLGLGLALGLQLGIRIGFRRNHSWLSIFTPRHNHSLCLFFIDSKISCSLIPHFMLHAVVPSE